MTTIKKSLFYFVILCGSVSEVSRHYHHPDPPSIVQPSLPEEGDDAPDLVWRNLPDYVSGLR